MSVFTYLRINYKLGRLSTRNGSIVVMTEADHVSWYVAALLSEGGEVTRLKVILWFLVSFWLCYARWQEWALLQYQSPLS